MTNEERYSSSGGGGSTASHMKTVIFKTEIAGYFFLVQIYFLSNLLKNMHFDANIFNS